MDEQLELAQTMLQQYQQWLADSQLQNAQLVARNKQLERQLAEAQAPDPKDPNFDL